MGEEEEEVEEEAVADVLGEVAIDEVVVDGESLPRGTPSHCGAKSGHFVTSIIHIPTSSGVSERASKRMSAVERASGRHPSEASSSEQASEWCERTSERTSEWPSTYVSILG